jgi:LysR family transcriptional regulator, hydrogen peroxide-inducible genes activator
LRSDYLIDVITLKQLRYLTALAEHRHFGKAAEACAVTQPALSMQIRELEKDLGVDLVERRPGEVILTATGAEVTRRAESVLAGARDLTDYARHSGRLMTGYLRLGVIPTLAPYLLPRVLPELQRRHADLRIDLRETQTRNLLDELARGSLDAALLALPIEEGDFETLTLFDDPFLLAVPAADARNFRSRIDPRDIDPRRLILLEEGHCLRDQALAFCGTRIEGASGLGATSLATVMQMVANGYGITLLPRVALPVELRDERVKVLRFRNPEPARQIGLAWRRTSPRKADFVALGQIVTEAVAGAPTARGSAA